YKDGAVVAPIDGTLILADAEKMIGTAVTPAEPLFRVARLREDWHASVWVAEKDVGRLIALFLRGKPDHRADVELLVAAFPGETFKGTLHRDDLAAQMTQRGKKSVLYVRVRIDEDSLKKIRVLPADANVRVRIAVPE